jgi:hypothetical protein
MRNTMFGSNAELHRALFVRPPCYLVCAPMRQSYDEDEDIFAKNSEYEADTFPC